MDSVDEARLTTSEQESKAPSHIIGIGASAGGLEAIEAFFQSMPPNCGVAFVLIQHLPPNHKSLMAQLLAKQTEMSIERAEEGMRIEKDTVYLIPPNRNLRIFHGRLLLSDQDRNNRGINLPIDVFFQSLAEDQGPRAVAVVLSGTGSDGTSGLRAIKEELGMVMAQSEDSAAFDGMPRSAIATGLVDFVLLPEDMPQQLISYLKHPYIEKNEFSGALLTDEEGLSRIFALVREFHKIDFSYYKPSTIVRRIQRRMAINQVQSLNDYVNYLEGNTNEIDRLHKDLLIGVTSFFRDADAFRALQTQYLPQLLAKSVDKKIRIWVAACSTGEEAYTIAMLCREIIDSKSLDLDIKIFATDVDRAAIEQAALGIYPESSVAKIPANILSKYFFHKDEGFFISRHVREMVVFAQHNVVKDPPFTNINLVSCRNMLIYLQPILQKRVLDMFNFSLVTKGVLFLGSSETTGEMSEYYEPVEPKWRIYQSTGRARSPVLSAATSNYDSSRWQASGVRLPPKKNGTRSPEEFLLRRLLSGIRGNYLPLCLVVDADKSLIHVEGDAKDYLSFPSGSVAFDITKIAHEDLVIPISTGLEQVLQNNEEIFYSKIAVRIATERREVNLRIKPLGRKDGQRKLVAIFIEELEAIEKSEDSKDTSYDIARESQQRIDNLERDLQLTRENLQSTVEELETSNEELQATNEELLASNEELQSTNEELQSVNEELFTVNAEYQGKISELTEVNNDLDNLLSNTRVATLFVDENLEIRRFTPEVSQLFKVIDQDIGRPISHIAHDFLDVDIIGVINEVCENNSTFEQHICTKDGSQFLLRVFPYQITPRFYAGVVLTFVNTSKLRRAQVNLSESLHNLDTLAELTPDAYILIDASGKILSCNSAVETVLGYEPEDIVDGNVTVIMPPDVAREHDSYMHNYLVTGNAKIIGKNRIVTAKCKDGTLIKVILCVAEIKYDNAVRFIGLLRPIADFGELANEGNSD